MKYRSFGLGLVFLLWLSACTQNSQVQEESLRLHRLQPNSVEELKEFFRWQPDRVPLISAHRGGPYPGYPENAIETFEHVLANTYAIIETDISLSSDSALVMMHDNTLDRTTTGKGLVSAHTLDQIRQLNLVDQEGNETPYRVPTLREVLDWGRGKTIFTLDVKRTVPFEKVIREVEDADAEAYAVIITYSLRDALKVHQLNPNLLISLSIQQPADLERALQEGLPAENIVAFTGTSQKDAALYELLHRHGIYCIIGTLGNLDKSAEARGDYLYRSFIEAGADILATDRPIEAATAIQPLSDIPVSRQQYFTIEE